ncbi:transporter [Acinetobacter sp. YH12116]|uniref:SphA family protein n=1 Tax=Acinetobacter sp. YH12116 TaxID=2601103 RepID=UPI0015D1B3DE|nr:transporter [Acinetobacter sp. YH12116]
MKSSFKFLYLLNIITCTSMSYAAIPSVTLPNGINLGATSFYDGFGGKPNDSIWQTYIGYSNAGNLKDSHGNNALPGKSSLKTTVINNQYVYMFDTQKTILGGHPGLDLIVPFIHLDADMNGPVQLKDKPFGMGDPTIGIDIQHDPIYFKNNPIFSDRLGVGITIPVGEYDKNKDINPGANFSSIFLYAAMTFNFNENISLSLRPYYYYNFKNTSPSSSIPLDDNIRNTQSGQFLTTNYNLGYKMGEHLTLGINGYYLHQLTKDKINNETIDNSKENVFAIGPAFMLDYGNNKFYVTSHKESKVENRFENSENVIFRWLYLF